MNVFRIYMDPNRFGLSWIGIQNRSSSNEMDKNKPVPQLFTNAFLRCRLSIKEYFSTLRFLGTGTIVGLKTFD
jgi:hypothetical protein